MPHQMNSNPQMDECIQACLDCYRSCLQTASQHCLEMGGKHTEPEHFRLMLDCAEICRSSAAFMLNGSPFHHQTCGVCAEVCEACARSCAAIGEMDDCVRACEHCADLCRQMAASGGMRGKQAASETRARQ